MSTNVWSVLMILTCLWVCPVRPRGFSWNIFSSSSSAMGGERAPTTMELGGPVADFALDGAKLLENARNKLAGPRNCWQEAYRKLFASCGEIMADKEKQSHLAWHLAICFQEDSGRTPFPSCGEGSKMVHCRKRLSESEDKVFLETNTLCRQLRVEAFKNNTERLINDLARLSKSAEEKLEVIEERSDQIIRESVQDTLSSVQMQANNLAEASKHVGEQINNVLVHSQSILEQSKEIATTQAELSKGKMEIREQIQAGMAGIEESYEGLANGMDKLKEEIEYIRREINSAVESMSSKMQDLQSTADDIGSVGNPQMQLLNGQTQAMGGLDKLHSFQEPVLEESRDYEVLNHELLQTLVEKVRALAEKAGGKAQSSYGSEEESLRDYLWVFDDQVDSKMNPTYVLPPERSPPTRRRRNQVVLAEEIGENCITTPVSRKYNLWPRK